MNIAETFEAVKKLPPEVIDSVMPHMGKLSFFAGILREDINLDGISKRETVKIGFDYCKKEMKKRNMSLTAKAGFLAGLPKLLKEYENPMRVLKKSADFVENPGNTFPLNQEWAACFFGYVKKVPDRDIQTILGKILAEELERKDSADANAEMTELSEEYFNRAVESRRAV